MTWIDKTAIAGFLAEAQRLADHAGSCTRAKVGAVLVDHLGLFKAYGVNMDPQGTRRCDAGECPRGLLSYEEMPPDAPYENCIYVHAEMVALGQVLGGGWAAAPLLNPTAATTCDQVRGWAIFVTHKPCHQCRPVLDALGVEVYHYVDPLEVIV
jgi:deoxycytidylate deaminase